MPKLYYTTTSCGAASFIAAKASGLSWEAEQVDLATHRTKVGDVDFYTINPKGNVPCIVLDDGSILNENLATLTFIGSQGEDNPLYPNDVVKRAHIVNALGYVASEWHKTIGNLFDPSLSDEVKAYFLAGVGKKLTFINDVLLKDKTYATGDEVSLADFYLYICLSWTAYLKVDIAPYPVVDAYFKAMAQHPAVLAAQEAFAADATHTN